MHHTALKSIEQIEKQAQETIEQIENKHRKPQVPFKQLKSSIYYCRNIFHRIYF